jgi:hypothetical protein
MKGHITKHEWTTVAKGKIVHEQNCPHCTHVRIKEHNSWQYFLRGYIRVNYEPPCITRKTQTDGKKL